MTIENAQALKLTNLNTMQDIYRFLMESNDVTIFETIIEKHNDKVIDIILQEYSNKDMTIRDMIKEIKSE